MDRFVLVVEDRPTHAKLFSEMLRGLGHAAIVALTGREGVAAARATKPSLVIVDILLSDLDGRKVIAELRSREDMEDIPILAISAVSDLAMQDDCAAAGADAFLGKPVRLAHFEDTIRTLLAGTSPCRRLEQRVSHP